MGIDLALPVLVVIGVFLVFIFWAHQLLTLMWMPDDAFPGRYDKLIWAGILIFTFVIGAIVFLIWRTRLEQIAVADQLKQASIRLFRFLRN